MDMKAFIDAFLEYDYQIKWIRDYKKTPKREDSKTRKGKGLNLIGYKPKNKKPGFYPGFGLNQLWKFGKEFGNFNLPFGGRKF